MEEDPSERAVDRYTRAEEQFRIDGGYAAESEVRRLAAGLGLDDDRLDLPVGALSGGQRRRVEIARILFAGSDVLLLDEPTNHLDSDAKDWLLGFMRAYRGALLVISHDLDLLDEAITRVLHLDRGDDERQLGTMRRVQGHLLPVPRRPREGRGPPGQGGPAPGQGDRPAADHRRPLRRQGHQGLDGPQHREAHRPHRGQRRRGPPGRPQGGRAVPAAAPARPHRARGQRTWPCATATSRCSTTSTFRRARRAAADHGPQRRRQDQPPAGAGRRAAARRRARSRSGTTSSAGYYAQEHEGIHAGRTILEHLREQVPHGGRPDAARRSSA